MQKWNIPMDRDQNVDDKNGVVRLIMFSAGVMVIKMSKMAHFCIFCWWQQKISHSLDKIFTCIKKILFSFFKKLYRFLDSELPLERCQTFKILSFSVFLADSPIFLYTSALNIARTLTSKSINHNIFWMKLIRCFRFT